MAFRRRKLRGQAEVVGAVLAIAALFTVFIFMFNYLNTAQQSAAHSLAVKRDLEIQREAEALLATKTGTQVCIVNNGTVPTKIVRFWIDTGNGVVVETPEDLGLTPDQVYLEPGASLCFSPPGDIKAIVTSRGKVYTAKELGLEGGTGGGGTSGGTAEVAESVLLEPVTLFQNGTVDDLLTNPNVELDPGLISEPTYNNISSGESYGMVRYSTSDSSMGLVLVGKYENVEITFEDRNNPGNPADIGNLFIGYKPGTTDEYNILITGPGDDSYYYWWWRGGYHPPRVTINPNNIVTDLTSGLGTTGWRIKIIGFKPYAGGFHFIYKDTYWGSINYETYDIDKARGYWWYYGGFNDQCSGSSNCQIFNELYLHGTAERVEIYIQDSNVPYSSYLPYLLVADYDGNGLPELIFTTEDTLFGNGNNCGNDDAGYYMDHSQGDYPFLIYLSGYSIDPTKYSMVVLTARVYYHDAEGGDTDCVNNPYNYMVGFYLVDPGPDGQLGTDDDKIVSSHELIYQQLDDWEDTYPPNKNFVTITVPLLVPEPQDSSTNNYVIAIGFQDPYGGYGTDDVEFTLAVESVGLTYYARG